jgi:hypothetical protein
MIKLTVKGNFKGNANMKWKAQIVLQAGEMKEKTVELTKWDLQLTALQESRWNGE